METPSYGVSRLTAELKQLGIVDWFSRKVPACNAVNQMAAFHCAETLKMTADSYRKPEIFNSDQGCQFASSEFVAEFLAHGIQYNSRRIHSVLQYQTPGEVCFGTCNRQSARYSKPEVFTPNLSIKSCPIGGEVHKATINLKRSLVRDLFFMN